MDRETPDQGDGVLVGADLGGLAFERDGQLGDRAAFPAQQRPRKPNYVTYVTAVIALRLVAALSNVVDVLKARPLSAPTAERADRGGAPNGLALGDLPGVEQVELDFPDDVGDAGLAGLAGGEVAGFPGFPRAGTVRAVADEEPGHEDH